MSQWSARALFFISLGCILGATLTPVGTEFQPDFVSCIICGGRGWADAVANLILYAPFGAALAWNGRTGLRAVGYAFLLSACIEAAQTVIPGRDPSLGDVTFNTLGAGAGLLAAMTARRWLVPSVPRAARLSLASATLATGLMVLTGVLLAPAIPAGPLSLWYAPDLPDMPWYHARVLTTRLDLTPIHPGLLSADRTAPLLMGKRLFLAAVAGSPVPSLAPLIVFADREDQVYLVGPDRNDLVLRYETRAARWGFDQPDIRLRGAFKPVARGDTVQIGIERRRVQWCLRLNRMEQCGKGFTLGDAWAMVMYPRHWPPWSNTLLGAMWVGGLALPVGLWGRQRLESAAAIALFGGALALVPSPVGLVATPLSEWCGAALGLGGGFALQAALRRTGWPSAGL